MVWLQTNLKYGEYSAKLLRVLNTSTTKESCIGKFWKMVILYNML
jgi:hypothetical protein